MLLNWADFTLAFAKSLTYVPFAFNGLLRLSFDSLTHSTVPTIPSLTRSTEALRLSPVSTGKNTFAFLFTTLERVFDTLNSSGSLVPNMPSQILKPRHLVDPYLSPPLEHSHCSSHVS
ncbi:hypothetical protein PENNAL_c0001G03861 [Penicillium nalgiovense]|uniref:Uncharacterized protein n=1 Tax=Penicillium nalgiovense TaxID=60175 RepID=A0A1V6Z9V4_PENNA|nr:hypothetical protein PENNAL_c0001G03861 [Penicillium nalgiovense]